MCGIAGIISFNQQINARQWLNEVSCILQHRGNDDDGISLFDNQTCYCYKIQHSVDSINHSQLKFLQFIPENEVPSKFFSTGLMHRRLSIIDLSELGHQPMCDESADVWITYNGEVYNYLELKENLIKKGIHFFSNSDTEVILKAYLFYGKKFVELLNGMWAFCIYDRRTNEFFLSRDRVGVKPLYYYLSKDIFAFASEQKAFLKSNLIPFEINYSALSKYLLDNVLEYQENGLFQNIIEVQPGENITVNTNDLSLKKERYFSLDNLLSPTINDSIDEKYLVEKTNHLVHKSVEEHLRSDVEVAISLSGGLDSSIIAVSASKKVEKPLHTFSISFPDNATVNEGNFAQIVSRQIHSQEHWIKPSAENFFKDLDELVYSQDIPIWSTSTYNQFLLMKEVQKVGIKVILSGQGSDELFAGYDHHYVAFWLSLLNKMKLVTLNQHLSKSSEYIDNPYTLFIKAIIKNFYSHKKRTQSIFLSKDILSCYKDENEHQITSHLNTELLKDLSYRRLKAFLKCEDRCSMWFGVESRLPFSDDIELLKWAFLLPENLKLSNGVRKYVLREAFKKELPFEIYSRKDKKAFEAPFKEWLVKYQYDILSEIKNGWKEIIDKKYLNNINSLENLSKSQLEIVFKLFILNRWIKQWK
jgi:asparagine synthase (glutamine-hydrolysing)